MCYRLEAFELGTGFIIIYDIQIYQQTKRDVLGVLTFLTRSGYFSIFEKCCVPDLYVSIPPRTFWPLFDLSTIKIGDGEKSTEHPLWKQPTEPPLWTHSEVPLLDEHGVQRYDDDGNPKSTEPPLWKQPTEPPLWKQSEVPLLDDNGEQRYDDDDNPTTIIARDPKSLHPTDVDNPR